MIKIFRGQGVVDGEGGSSKARLKWGGREPLRDLSKNILKQGNSLSTLSDIQKLFSCLI